MLIDNEMLNHKNGKLVSLAGFGAMALGELGNLGLEFIGWDGNILSLLCAIAVFGGMFLAAAGSFLMYNESRKINDIILCGTLIIGMVFFWIPSPHFILTLIFNCLILSYLASFALDAFRKDNRTFAMIFAGLLVFSAVIAPVMLSLLWNWYIYSYGNSILWFLAAGFSTFCNVIAVACPALCLLETNKKTLDGEEVKTTEE